MVLLKLSFKGRTSITGRSAHCGGSMSVSTSCLRCCSWRWLPLLPGSTASPCSNQLLPSWHCQFCSEVYPLNIRLYLDGTWNSPKSLVVTSERRSRVLSSRSFWPIGDGGTGRL